LSPERCIGAYYGITGNMGGLKPFYAGALRRWQKWLNRRSRKADGMKRPRFNTLIREVIPLPQPRIVHSIYAAKPCF
jgi:hypothetical protein